MKVNDEEEDQVDLTESGRLWGPGCAQENPDVYSRTCVGFSTIHQRGKPLNTLSVCVWFRLLVTQRGE